MIGDKENIAALLKMLKEGNDAEGEFALPSNVVDFSYVEIQRWRIEDIRGNCPELFVELLILPVIKTEYSEFIDKVPEIGQEIWR